MRESEVIKKWLSCFGRDVDGKLIEEHVTSQGNHLWHLFTWGEVPCLKGDEARKAFDALHYAEAIRFYDGYSNHIEEVAVIEKLTSLCVDEDEHSDVYVVAKDFSWTYVRTHEADLGPYFCEKR